MDTNLEPVAWDAVLEGGRANSVNQVVGNRAVHVYVARAARLAYLRQRPPRKMAERPGVGKSCP